jgi:hypothetical protein
MKKSKDRKKQQQENLTRNNKIEVVRGSDSIPIRYPGSLIFSISGIANEGKQRGRRKEKRGDVLEL